ncbi:glycoside hydrolase superfamily [Naematelia encephala]|uniref:Glycoside hydrolase superfamily n=1 Tax=Naematelia encephala TaxID=71784 RepID=A0A1Y2BM33_9TREE|nr:glycoside hydrolase superfamily [Naematelia encephala]
MLIDLQKVLAALGLVSSIIKPVPVVGGVVGGVVDTVGGVLNSTVGSSTGAVGGLLGGAGGLIAAVGVGSNSTDTDADNSTTTYSAASDDACAFQPYTPDTPVQLESFAPYDASRALIYRYRQQQSVNLGSWFVQEQWMNPSLFTCANGNKQAELDVAQGWGGVDSARQVLERHWDEWIGESDFAYLASIGINTVRLPIGYWSLGPVYCQGTPFESVSSVYVNAWARVVRAINWAEKYGLGILVDLHGNQNGQAHSGVSDGQQNLFDNPANVQLTMNALTYLTQQLVKVNNVVGIEILNEPSNVDGLPAFSLTTLRQVSPEAAAFPFYIHDGFDMSRFADYVSTRSDFVVLDHHSYFVFGDHDSQEIPAKQLTSSLQPGQGSLSQQMISAATEERRNIVIDEFSCALSGNALVNSSDAVTDRRRFCTGQMESYTNATAGWSFWSQ